MTELIAFCAGPSYIYFSKNEKVLIVLIRLNTNLIHKRNLRRLMNYTVVFLRYFDKYSIYRNTEKPCIHPVRSWFNPCARNHTGARTAKVNNELALRSVLFFEKWRNDNVAAGLPEAWSTASIFPASSHYALVLSISFHPRFFQPTLSLCFPCLLPTFLYRPVHPSFFSNSLPLSFCLSFFLSLSILST